MYVMDSSRLVNFFLHLNLLFSENTRKFLIMVWSNLDQIRIITNGKVYLKQIFIGKPNFEQRVGKEQICSTMYTLVILDIAKRVLALKSGHMLQCLYKPLHGMLKKILAVLKFFSMVKGHQWLYLCLFSGLTFDLLNLETKTVYLKFIKNFLSLPLVAFI